jgi:hypothetical protein
MSHLFQTRQSATEKFAHGGCGNAESSSDFGIPEPLQAEEEAAALLLGEGGEGLVEAEQTLALEQRLFRVVGAGEPRFDLGVINLGVLGGAELQAEVMSDAKNPGAGVADFFAAAHGGVQTEKSFLGGFLSAGRGDAHEEEIAVDVVAGFFEKLRDFCLQ